MKRLIKEGFVTTILGLGIIVFSGMLIWTSRATAADLSGWLALGILFLRSKDSILGIPKKDEEI